HTGDSFHDYEQVPCHIEITAPNEVAGYHCRATRGSAPLAGTVDQIEGRSCQAARLQRCFRRARLTNGKKQLPAFRGEKRNHGQPFAQKNADLPDELHPNGKKSVYTGVASRAILKT
ncbi:MAG: hypothetical protein ACXVI1_10835, partial [Halobacteriota archaeon]